ncbi:hypothetical protein Plec18167_000999 [Paecilomyces lecythidis]|uniref:Uncharacterized protein n=1 Tax=Paecilomyces lecythidis TaxID=3004212 RepID=A0ABR3YB21_9EURO
MPPRGQKRLHDGRTILHFDPATLTQDELEVLDSMNTIWDDPNGLEKLRKFKWIFDLLVKSRQSQSAHNTLPATFFENVIAAKNAVNVQYNPSNGRHMVQLNDTENLSDGKLSQWADDSVNAILRSKYVENAGSESISRTVIDIVFCDRLNHLDDQDADRHLNWFPEMPISVESASLGKTIHGKVDWCLSHGNNKSELDTTLIVLEAKKLGTAPTGLPQLIIYLAAVQDSRKQAVKPNYSVFGILSDSVTFYFAHLDSQRNLFVTKSYDWLYEKSTIVQWIDRILRDAIHASPHTTPVRTGTTSLMAYNNFLNHSYRFGLEGEIVETVEDNQIQRYAIVESLGRGYLVTPMNNPESSGDAEQAEITHSHPDHAEPC